MQFWNHPMNLASLAQELIAGGYRNWYLDDGHLDDAIILHKTAVSWEVYYSERGQKVNLRLFPTEEEACNYFLAYIKSGGSRFL